MSTELTIIQKVRGELDKRENEFRALLPRHINPGHLIRIAQTAMILNEDLQQCTQKSLIIACTKSAETGIMPDGEEGALVSYNVKVSKKNEPDRWEKQAKFLPMVRGIRMQVLQSGICKDWKVRIVREADFFEHIDGDVETIVHRPTYDDESPITHVYSIAYLDNGELNRHVMSMKTVDKIRSKSRSAERGPWADWLEEMVKKTCLKQHAKALPRSKDNIAQQRFMGAMRAIDDAEGVIDVTPAAPALESPRMSMHEAARQRLAEIADQSDHDPETGEVIPPPAEKKTRSPRKTANERLAEAEGRTLTPAASEPPKAATNGNGMKLKDEAPGEGRELRYERDESEDPAGFRDSVDPQETEGEDEEEQAYRAGWHARAEGKTRVPPRELDRQQNVSAWLSGYGAFQKSVDIGSAPKNPEASNAMLNAAVKKAFV